MKLLGTVVWPLTILGGHSKNKSRPVVLLPRFNATRVEPMLLEPIYRVKVVVSRIESLGELYFIIILPKPGAFLRWTDI